MTSSVGLSGVLGDLLVSPGGASRIFWGSSVDQVTLAERGWEVVCARYQVFMDWLAGAGTKGWWLRQVGSRRGSR